MLSRLAKYTNDRHQSPPKQPVLREKVEKTVYRKEVTWCWRLSYAYWNRVRKKQCSFVMITRNDSSYNNFFAARIIGDLCLLRMQNKCQWKLIYNLLIISRSGRSEAVIYDDSNHALIVKFKTMTVNLHDMPEYEDTLVVRKTLMQGKWPENVFSK